MTEWTTSSTANEDEQHAAGVFSQERAVGEDQLLVLFYSEDRGEAVDIAALFDAVGHDATTRAPAGWRLVSTDTFSTRQMGTAGNMLFQTGGQFSTQAATLAIYRRA